MQLTDQLSVGASATLGTAFEQLGFVGPIVGSAMVHDYGVRGTVGCDYALSECDTIGAFYQSRMDFQFPDAIRVGGVYHDLNIDQPDTFGLGVADNSLMDGNLLLAADVYYKLWEDAALWKDLLVNQWAFATGAQLTHGSTNIASAIRIMATRSTTASANSLEAIRSGKRTATFQAANVPLVYQNRITAGIGRQGLIVPNLDLDLFAGGLFKGADRSAPTPSLAGPLLHRPGLDLELRRMLPTATRRRQRQLIRGGSGRFSCRDAERFSRQRRRDAEKKNKALFFSSSASLRLSAEFSSFVAPIAPAPGRSRRAP